ncbi:uncharacterized protein LOC122847331 [Aphidius gifuensis]|uniref:uncharacterized protein LOC122847331 n=1 Tax=Aphidius gifuensis TaxID=684658 RepID=UPI001CDD1348|nr:uncharacterized protein LOC122847331 [Aphidius gifuensis]
MTKLFKVLDTNFTTSLVYFSGENDDSSDKSYFPQNRKQKVFLKKNDNVICGGVLLSSSLVLTTVSCMGGEALTQGVAKDYPNNSTHHYNTHQSNMITVSWNSKIYDVKWIESHSFVRRVGSGIRNPVDGLAILKLEKEITLKTVNKQKDSQQVFPYFAHISHDSILNEEFIQLMDSSSYVLNGEIIAFKINHGEICKGATDDHDHDRLCGIYMGEKNKECRIYPGDPVFNARYELIGITESFYNCKYEAVPFTFINLSPHLFWIHEYFSE